MRLLTSTVRFAFVFSILFGTLDDIKITSMESPGSASAECLDIHRFVFLLGVDDNALRGSNCSPSVNDYRRALNVVTHEVRSGAFHSMLITAEHASYKGPVEVSMIAHSLRRAARVCPVRPVWGTPQPFTLHINIRT
jgi:hypothetical protein